MEQIALVPAVLI